MPGMPYLLPNQQWCDEIWEKSFGSSFTVGWKGRNVELKGRTTLRASRLPISNSGKCLYPDGSTLSGFVVFMVFIPAASPYRREILCNETISALRRVTFSIVTIYFLWRFILPDSRKSFFLRLTLFFFLGLIISDICSFLAVPRIAHDISGYIFLPNSWKIALLKLAPSPPYMGKTLGIECMCERVDN